MARKCQLTGIKPLSGHAISHAHNVTNRWQKPNLQSKKIYIPELGRSVRLKLSTRALRTIDKKGLLAFLRDQGLKLSDVT
jgi:large subunit ribosomal protein L28